ncbi:glycosyltransferase [Streptomyces sp. TRM76323]|uniref:Glycosyltransferase n=1 Tax=Streptomyces tamarix TaxID=3078565 RepID=A0ABU3QMJ2_9ACTN|nr:glycosyltransferase [Streptomyces tamarix]MDT9683978.1 glycosyltransferase [Streptomyces tamarix]
MTAHETRTTVVVITRDRRDQLLRTLDRLARLPERPPVVVVDNASSDGTAEAVAARHPEVTLLCPGRNLGAVGRTLGARHAHTPYVAFSDDDSWWEPGALAAAERLLDAHPRLGLVAAAVRVGDGGRDDPLNAELAASPLGREHGLPGTRVLGFLACAAVARRQAFLEAGGYHPVVFFAGEEQLLAYDMEACGWAVCHCPEVVAVHSPSGGVRGGRRAVMRRNAALTAWLRRPLSVAARRTGALAAQARRDPEAREALRGVLERLPAALRARRRLPPRVEAAARRVEGDRVRGSLRRAARREAVAR